MLINLLFQHCVDFLSLCTKHFHVLPTRQFHFPKAARSCLSQQLPYLLVPVSTLVFVSCCGKILTKSNQLKKQKLYGLQFQVTSNQGSRNLKQLSHFTSIVKSKEEWTNVSQWFLDCRQSRQFTIYSTVTNTFYPSTRESEPCGALWV